MTGSLCCSFREDKISPDLPHTADISPQGQGRQPRAFFQREMNKASAYKHFNGPVNVIEGTSVQKSK